MAFETTAAKLWKRLTPDERLAAANAFWKEPPQELLGSALGAIIKLRHLRPQVARQMPPEELARILATVIDPGEALAAALLVALHLEDRRALLAGFLDALELPHENGLIKDEPGPAPPPLSAAQAEKGAAALRAAYPAPQIRTYFNTLWLQDPQRWGVLEQAPFSD